MAEERSDRESRDPEGIQREVSPGGRSSRGPNADPGGETVPGGLVPPYEGRTSARGESQISDELTDSVERIYGDVQGGGAGQTASPAMESRVRPDEVNHEAPESPLGVGESVNRRGEDQVDRDGKEAGRADTGTEAASERPTGASDSRDVSGVAHQEAGD
jgi:hypothetical protein